MSRSWKDAILIFLYTMATDIIIVINSRALNRGDLFYTGLSDFTIATFGFLLYNKIGNNDEGTNKWTQWLAYAFGGVVGGVAGVLLSIHGLGI